MYKDAYLGQKQLMTTCLLFLLDIWCLLRGVSVHIQYYSTLLGIIQIFDWIF